MSSDDDFYDRDEYRNSQQPKQKKGRSFKRRKLNRGNSYAEGRSPVLSLNFLLEGAQDYNPEPSTSFEQVIEELLPEFMNARASFLAKESEIDIKGHRLRPLTRSETTTAIVEAGASKRSLRGTMLLRKLKVERERCREGIHERHIESFPVPVTPTPPVRQDPPVNTEVIDALYEIRTTPFENSFLSRLHGSREPVISGLIAVDWETTTPWMDLMNDIRDHYSLSHPERKQPAESSAPIVYTSLQPYHLPQVHDLLESIFWKGVDITDSLDYWPEKCTVIATYKKLVVGLAILSSPQETYITYLAVKAGWDKSQIARTMLYHLITLNPSKDITLHVSVNNSAMLLYNQFGFKAEEFVAGFYEDYLDPVSRASKNAFRLRLRQ